MQAAPASPVQRLQAYSEMATRRFLFLLLRRYKRPRHEKRVKKNKMQIAVLFYV
jgi:hypothetical protein